MSNPLRVTVWNEFRQERRDERVRAVYADGIHAPLASALRAAGHAVAAGAGLFGRADPLEG